MQNLGAKILQFLKINQEKRIIPLFSLYTAPLSIRFSLDFFRVIRFPWTVNREFKYSIWRFSQKKPAKGVTQGVTQEDTLDKKNREGN